MAIDYKEFALAEENRILGEHRHGLESQTDDATVEAFEKASDALIGPFLKAVERARAN